MLRRKHSTLIDGMSSKITLGLGTALAAIALCCFVESSFGQDALVASLDAMENDVDRGFDSNYLIGKLDAINEMTREALKKLDDKKLDHFYASRYGDIPKEFSLREILQRLADHEANHRGQMSMIKRVIRGG